MIAVQARPSRCIPISAPRRSLYKARVVGIKAKGLGNEKLESIKPSLPQYDLGGQDDRKLRLDDFQQRYILDPEFIPPFVLAKHVPMEDQFSTQYIVFRAVSLVGIIIGKVFKPFFNPSLLGNELARFLGPKPENKNAPFEKMDDYKQLFHPGFPFFGIELPKEAETFRNDAVFAAARTSGPNPVMIKALVADDAQANVLKLVKPENFPKGFDLKTELSKGTLYVCDYTGTDPTYRAPAFMNGDGKHPLGVKSLPKPLAFFWWGREQLLPIAIQLDCSKEPDNYVPTGSRVYTPNEKATNDWLFAKICVQIADANHHELATHLGRTHLVMEPIAVAAMRQLDTQHPIGIMLRVHMRFIIANNALAHPTFFSPVDGTLEQVMAGSFREIAAFLGAVYKAWDIDSSALPADLEARGVGPSSTLKTYPFRQYSLWLWDAIEEFVTSYVKFFYSKDGDLENDYELQAWASECASDSSTGAKVKGFPEKITSTDQLIKLLTNIIFTCGPMHSAVNYAQKEMYFTPHYPLSAYVDVSKLAAQTEPITDKQLLQMLPPYTPANRQIFVLEFLTSYRYDNLGNWDTSMKEMFGPNKGFDDVFAGDAYAPVRVAMDRFESNLARAEEMMLQANKEENKTFPYEYLLPSKVLNSISI